MLPKGDAVCENPVTSTLTGKNEGEAHGSIGPRHVETRGGGNGLGRGRPWGRRVGILARVADIKRREGSSKVTWYNRERGESFEGYALSGKPMEGNGSWWKRGGPYGWLQGATDLQSSSGVNR